MILDAHVHNRLGGSILNAANDIDPGIVRWHITEPVQIRPNCLFLPSPADLFNPSNQKHQIRLHFVAESVHISIRP